MSTLDDHSAEEAVKAFIAVYNRHNPDAYAPMLDHSIILYSPLFSDGVMGIEARKKIDEKCSKLAEAVLSRLTTL